MKQTKRKFAKPRDLLARDAFPNFKGIDGIVLSENSSVSNKHCISCGEPAPTSDHTCSTWYGNPSREQDYGTIGGGSSN